MGTVSGPLVAAIESAWGGIRLRHPDVPEVVVAVASGSAGRGRAPTRGHFGPDRWLRNGAWMPELFIGAEGLAAGAPDVLTTLLHEAAHGIARTRQIRDVSSDGRYHNARYRTIAEEIGLAVARHQRYGWSLTTLPGATARRYRSEITLLANAIVAQRRPEHGTSDTDSIDVEHHHNAPAAAEDVAGSEKNSREIRRDRNGRSLECQCRPPRRLRGYQRTIDAGPILCGVCQEPFLCVNS
ncbi:hypothetical protein OG563_30560 [Nocardia vinacea]|uniref:SprT-like family protein n=1 Tax=Nocardia vinacea TaxID=96468 RepID=A0ABZ1YKG9_9NOCA|nr:hypothetical protein [Nocardia vinacea]